LKKYEGIYILSDKLKADTLEKAWAGVRAEIEKLGGVIGTEEHLGRRTFAREMQKHHAGNYVNVSFEMEPEKLKTLQSQHKLNEDIFRAMIVIARKPEPEKKSEEPAAAAPSA
jgi:ribosomal protein S6